MGHNDCLDQTKKDFQQMTSHARASLIATFMAEHCLVRSFRRLSLYIYICLHKQFSYKITIWNIFLSNFFFSSSWKCQLELLKFLLFRPTDSKIRIISVNPRFLLGSIDRSFLIWVLFSKPFWWLLNILIVILIWSANMDPLSYSYSVPLCSTIFKTFF